LTPTQSYKEFLQRFQGCKLRYTRCDPKGGIVGCFWFSRCHLCMGSHYWIKNRSRRSYVWL